MAGLYNNTPTGSGALSPLSKRRLQAALLKADVQAASGGQIGAAQGALNGANINKNPGTEMGPPQNVNGLSFAKEALTGLAGGFGFGPLSMANLAGYATNPSSFADMGTVNINGIGPVTTKPGPLGPLMDMAGFGALARTAGALNAANLQRIAATDPNASMVSGKGIAGAFSNGTFSGNLPGGLEAATRRAMVHEIAQRHYDRTRDPRGGTNAMGGRSSVDNSPDDRDNR
jgi:hypothetical protein